jgi:hypothetical protein
MQTVGYSATSVAFVWLFIAVVCMLLGARHAESKNPGWLEGTLLGRFLDVVGGAIAALRSKPPGDASAETAPRTKPAVQPHRQPVPADKRPAAAQARLDEIAQAINNEEYARAFTPMDYEMFDADRRGDVETLKALLGLAKRIERVRYQEPKIKGTAQEFARRAQEAISTFVSDV